MFYHRGGEKGLEALSPINLNQKSILMGSIPSGAEPLCIFPLQMLGNKSTQRNREKREEAPRQKTASVAYYSKQLHALRQDHKKQAS